MGTLLTVIAITLAAASFKLGGETAAEYFAKYMVDQQELGLSTEEPASLPAAGTAPVVEADAAGARTAPVPVLLAASAPDAAGLRPGPAGDAAGQIIPASAPAAPSKPEAPAAARSAAATPAAATPAADAASRSPAEVADPLLSLVSDTPHRRPDGTVFMPIAAQHVFGLRTVIGRRVAVPATVELPGRIVTNPSTAHLIQSAEDGFVEIAQGGFPYAGQRVRRGDLLAYLRPNLSILERAQLDNQMQELVNEIDLARKRMARLEEVVMIRYRANRIEQMRVEIEGMRRQLDVLRASVDRPIELRAQTDGIVSRVSAASGQLVEPGHTIFEIVDPSRLWVSASAFDAGFQDRIVSASAVTPDGRRLDLQFIGGGLTLHQQALPLHFEIVGSPAGLTVETPVSVVVQLEGKAETGLKVPRSSVTRTSDGRDLIWERRSAEGFVAHHVSVTPIDAESVLVTSPIAGSMRIVTAGVATLGQVQ